MLLDNKSHGRVIDELRVSLDANSKMAVLTALFSVFGYSALKSELGKINELRLLLANPDATEALNWPERLTKPASRMSSISNEFQPNAPTGCAKRSRYAS